jgi:hypothetical protein
MVTPMWHLRPSTKRYCELYLKSAIDTVLEKEMRLNVKASSCAGQRSAASHILQLQYGKATNNPRWH